MDLLGRLARANCGGIIGVFHVALGRVLIERADRSRLCAYFAVTLELRAIVMEHSGALFDSVDAESIVIFPVATEEDHDTQSTHRFTGLDHGGCAHAPNLGQPSDYDYIHGEPLWTS